MLKLKTWFKPAVYVPLHVCLSRAKCLQVNAIDIYMTVFKGSKRIVSFLGIYIPFLYIKNDLFLNLMYVNGWLKYYTVDFWWPLAAIITDQGHKFICMRKFYQNFLLTKSNSLLIFSFILTLIWTSNNKCYVLLFLNTIHVCNS